MNQLAAKTYLALVHHPVYDKHRRVVTTSITNLDIHDIARSSRTYGLAGYIIVHPVAAQRELAGRILGHWGEEGLHDFRRDALSLVRVVSSVEDAIQHVTDEQRARPLLVATSAKAERPTLSTAELREDPELKSRPMLLLFGTGWGLTTPVMDGVDRLLVPIKGPTEYNHLSVRSAAGIMLDRLFGEPE